MPPFVAAVPLAKAYRLMNHGPTVLVSAGHGDSVNVMAAAWAMPLDFDPPKVTVVIDKATRTRELVEASGVFALSVPCVGFARQTLAVGTDSARTLPDKLARHAIATFNSGHEGAPLVDGCIAWLACRVLPEPGNQARHDLFIAEVLGAWADTRVFADGHWHFDEAPDDLRTLHYVAGGQFYVIGRSLTVGK
jgi:flavin reductase (DIM6/NTAB) family NADH-FMN oxidoreductase RutF